ncbi:rod-binding protein [Sphingomonas sp.]|uniref:rod-binding protein n=1 Tax=Sphingomonas sp. TaxID=28214 RepID=UPI001B0353D5|nr:rod-binding protein [Sphingomonas sp.]MBO9713489.1 rod-binding protein [Sphingomonas sp.]
MADSSPLSSLPVSVTAPAPKMPKVDPKSADTAKQFEAVFLTQMTQLMLESVQQDGDFGGGHGEEMFRGVLAEKLGTEMSKRGGVGLAPIVMDQILKLQQAGK